LGIQNDILSRSYCFGNEHVSGYVPSAIHAYALQTAAVEYVFLVHDAHAVGGQRFQTLAGVAHVVLLARVQPPVRVGRGDDQLRLAEREPRLFVVAKRVGVHLFG